MTYKERMLTAIKGKQADVIPFAPRLDLWYAAHQSAGTLPDPRRDSNMDTICRTEGWGLYKATSDYRYLQEYLFEGIKLVPYVVGYLEWVADTGDDGLVGSPVCDASSPMPHIKKFLFDPTDFYIFYKEQPGQIEAFAASVAHFCNQILEVTAESPADVITWGGNYDDTITYPPYFGKDILPFFYDMRMLSALSSKLLPK